MSKPWEEYIGAVDFRVLAALNKIRSAEKDLEALMQEVLAEASAVGRAHSNEPDGDTHDWYIELAELANNISCVIDQIERVEDLYFY